METILGLVALYFLLKFMFRILKSFGRLVFRLLALLILLILYYKPELLALFAQRLVQACNSMLMMIS